MSKISEYYGKTMSVYNSMLKLGLKIPFVKVGRETYLQKILKDKVSDDQLSIAIEEGPLSVLSVEEIESLAKREMWIHAFVVSILSFFAAVPSEGWLMWLAIAFDFIQYQLMIFVLLQKILYLYGSDELLSKEDVFDEKSDWLLLFVSTVMIGKHQMLNMMKSATGVALKQVVQRFAVKMFSKLVLLNVVRQTAKWLGVSLSKEWVLKSSGSFVVFFSCVISAFITLWLFVPMNNRLIAYLSNQVQNGVKPTEITFN